MPYATAADVRAALAPDGDTSGATAAALTDGQLDQAVGDAAAEVDARLLSAGYQVPFPDPAPPLVASIARDIAAYLATLRYRKATDLEERDPAALRYDRARAMLEAVAAGTARLDVDADQQADTGGVVAVVNRWQGDLFTAADVGLGYR